MLMEACEQNALHGPAAANVRTEVLSKTEFNGRAEAAFRYGPNTIWLGDQPDMSSMRTQTHGELSRLNLIFLLILSMLLIFPAVSRAQTAPAAGQIAKTYGLDSFGQVEAIRYTWNHVNRSE